MGEYDEKKPNIRQTKTSNFASKAKKNRVGCCGEGCPLF